MRPTLCGMAAQDQRRWEVRRCALCADVVGVYERAVLILGNGSVVSASPLSVERAAEIVEAYHLGRSPVRTGEA